MNNTDIEEPHLQFNKASLNRKGELLAVVSVYEFSKLLYEDRINLTKESDRQKLVNKFGIEYGMDDVEEQLLENMKVIREELEAAPPLKFEPDNFELSARFPGLVDITDDEGILKFLFLDKNGLKLKSKAQIADKTLLPPNREHLPWLLPRTSEVKRYLSENTEATLYEALKSYFKQVSQLPSELHYGLLALWVVHSYLLEKFHYSPYILFHGDQEKGKTRTGKAVAYVAFRGIATETLNEASFFRSSNDLMATIFLDVMNLWRKAEKRGSEDILLQRFERGGKVPRVLWPEKGKFNDTCYYDVFGATVVASNELPREPFLSRCIVINMPESSKQFSNPVTPENGLPLRERLVAFRAKWLTGRPLPSYIRIVPGRLGDILHPLGVVSEIMGQEARAEFCELSKRLFIERMEDRASSKEARVILAIQEVSEHLEEEKIGITTVTENYNMDLLDREKRSPESIGRMLRNLGFKRSRLKDGRRAIYNDPKLLKTLNTKYGLGLSTESSSNRGSQQLSEPSYSQDSIANNPRQFGESSEELLRSSKKAAFSESNYGCGVYSY